MSHLLGDVTAVLMARDPRLGAVKTRLTAGNAFSQSEARQVAWIMLRGIALRLQEAVARLVLAVTPDDGGAELAVELGLAGDRVEVLGQGPGDLGRRLDHVWRQVGTSGPVAFFGGDSPDIPAAALAAIPATLATSDIAIGPTADGGYWTLAAAKHRPEVLVQIDWGSACVYDQTRRRALDAGLVVGSLPLWHDVDHPGDVKALRLRLRQLPRIASGQPDGTDPSHWMAEQLDRLEPSNSPSTPS
jgi:glycosyltransferase A (GT-A) superfamily protein (DUF2064 family)